MNLRDPRGRAIKDGIPTSPHGGRQSALVENNSDDSITAILEVCVAVVVVTSSLSVQSLKKKPPITDGVYSVVVVRYVCR